MEGQIIRNNLNTNSHNRKLKRYLYLILFFLAIYSFSLYIAGYLLNRTADINGYHSQKIDTIKLTPADRAHETPAQPYKFAITGRISFSDGSPYRYGTVELRSEPRYSKTDYDGIFIFEDVEPGKHTISAIQNGVAVCLLRY